MKHIIRLVERRRKTTIAFLKQLVAIPTVNPPGNAYERFVDTVERRCRRAGLSTRRWRVPQKLLRRWSIREGSARINLVARWDTGAKKTLHINTHYDVVPASGKWRTNPFRPVVKRGKLYGRGSEDMKANIACVLTAVETLKTAGILPRVNIEISFTPDEETGGRPGLAYLLQRGLIRADYALGEGYADNYAAVGNKGMLWLEVEFLGKPAHSSTPYLGKNAFEAMLDTAQELRRMERRLRRRKTRFGTKNPRDAYSTMVLGGVLRGGAKVNIVPGSACFSIDRRFLPEESAARAKKEIREIIGRSVKKNRHVRVRVNTLAQEEAVVSPVDERMFGAFSRAVSAVLKKRLKTALMPGGTDLRYFIRRGIPALGYSVKGDCRAHADNEFVYVDSVMDTAKIFALFMAELS